MSDQDKRTALAVLVILGMGLIMAGPALMVLTASKYIFILVFSLGVILTLGGWAVLWHQMRKRTS